MKYSAEEKACIWLSVTPGISALKRQVLLDNYDSLAELYDQFDTYRDEVVDLVGQAIYDRLLLSHDDGSIDNELDALDRLGAVAITLHSADYPKLLAEIQQPPVVLYCQGDIQMLRGLCLAVVGTRNPSRYGQDVTQNFVADLCTNGITIVSGMARGVDAIAHRTALQYNKPTIGVLPCGIDKVYPAENVELYAQMKEKALLVTEYPSGSRVQQFTFVERNRIISGLSRGVLVTEAGEKSGSMLTVGHALEQSRDIYAVPGNIYSKTSMGTNKILKDMQGALVTNAFDILECYQIAVDQGPVCSLQLDIIEEQIVEALQQEDKHIEQLIQLTGLTVSQLAPVLTKLELMGLLHKLSGNYYGV